MLGVKNSEEDFIRPVMDEPIQSLPAKDDPDFLTPDLNEKLKELQSKKHQNLEEIL